MSKLINRPVVIGYEQEGIKSVCLNPPKEDKHDAVDVVSKTIPPVIAPVSVEVKEDIQLSIKEIVDEIVHVIDGEDSKTNEETVSQPPKKYLSAFELVKQ